jgi:hypothetical protein
MVGCLTAQIYVAYAPARGLLKAWFADFLSAIAQTEILLQTLDGGHAWSEVVPHFRGLLSPAGQPVSW